MSALALGLTSCNNDDDNSTPILVTQIIVTSQYNGATTTSTTNFTYDGNKIVRQTTANSDDYSTFTYTGDFITKVEHYQSGALYSEDFYTYDSEDRLATYEQNLYDDPNNTYIAKCEYTYNANGTVAFSYNHGYFPTPSYSYTGLIQLNAEGAVTQIGTSSGVTYSYTYDDKNSPFKNILGIDKLFFEGSYANPFLRNFLTEVTDNNNSTYTTSHTYTYNSDNFPIQSTETGGSETVVNQYVYNQ